MDSLHSTCQQKKNCHLIRPWLAAQLVCVVLTCAPLLSGQYYLYIYAEPTVDTDKTYYGIGITDFPGMPEHSAWVSVNVWSPNMRHDFDYQSVESTGYAVGNVSLSYDANDEGDYVETAEGDGWCPWSGSPGGGSVEAVVEIPCRITCNNPPDGNPWGHYVNRDCDYIQACGCWCRVEHCAGQCGDGTMYQCGNHAACQLSRAVLCLNTPPCN